jgi:hypothetical protein
MRDTIDMAREAGFKEHNGLIYVTTINDDCAKEIERFEALVRADEREACAKVCEDDAWRCKKIAVETQNKKANAAALEAYLCAEAIRARSNT